MDNDIATLNEGQNALWITFQLSVAQQTGDKIQTLALQILNCNNNKSCNKHLNSLFKGTLGFVLIS